MSGQWLLPITVVPAGAQITVGQRLPVSCMFDVHFALVEGARVGFLFTSRFEVKNGGSYLMTYLNNKGPATEHETLVKDENLVIFHYPNKGTLAISPLVNPEIDTIFTEQ
jgi:hypothetical protein